MPNFDKLAAEGARFANCHAQYPVCGASRCSLFTGWPTNVRGHCSLFYFSASGRAQPVPLSAPIRIRCLLVRQNDALAAQSFYYSVTQWIYLDHMPIGGDGKRRQTGPIPVSHFARPFISGASPGRTKTGDYKNIVAVTNILESASKVIVPSVFFFRSSHRIHLRGRRKAFAICINHPTSITYAPSVFSPKPNYIEAIRKAYGIDKMPEETFRAVRALCYELQRLAAGRTDGSGGAHEPHQ